MNIEDTIVAVATPPGRSAIAVIRMSGSDAPVYADRVFTPAAGKPLSSRHSHTATYGLLHRDSTPIDSVIALAMWAPHSYTGENTVEFYCHGGPVITRCVLDALAEAGARPALPGEFSRRAFLNGKIDLTQAEAVADIINAPTERAQRAALAQLSGSLSAVLKPAHDALCNAHTHIEAVIDFSEDVDEELCTQITRTSLESAHAILEKLHKNADTGRILTDGFRAVITGPPNVGKSSLLNLLAQEERALVTDIPGTTRDSLEVDVTIQGWPVRFIDTAGIRQSDDTLELHGIARTQKMIDLSDVIIIVHDVSIPPPHNIEETIAATEKKHPIICVLNKCDLPNVWPQNIYTHLADKFNCICCSAHTALGLKNLHDAIASLLYNYEPATDDDLFIMRSRHKKLICHATESIAQAIYILNI